MTQGMVKTQGTKLYMVDPGDVGESSTEPFIVKMACPTGISGIGGGAKDQIESTCLDTVGDKTYGAGLGNPAPISVPFNLVPRDYSHQNLFLLKRSGVDLKWMVVLTDNPDDPANEEFEPDPLNSEFEFTPPTDRSAINFTAYIAEVSIDIATNEFVRGTLTLQRSGTEVFHPYEPA